MKTSSIEFIRAALVRAIRTGCQSLLSFMTVGMGLFDIDWITVISITLMTMLMSILTSIVSGLPETGGTGSFIIDNSDPDKSKWTLRYDGDPDQLKPGDSVRFKVEEKSNARTD